MLLAVVLLALAVTAWVTTSQMAMPGMRTGILTGMHTMEPGMEPSMEPGTGSAAAFGLFLGTWVVMMAAMMLPSITPFMVGMSRLLRGRTGQGTMGALVVGYLLVWAAAGLLGYAVVLGFESVSAEGGSVAVRTGGGVLLVAGVYQFTPLKQWCLVRCRSPLALVVRYADVAARNRGHAVTVGVRHGGYCLGCCWALMGVLLAAGVMSLAWMATIAAVITAEKVLPRAGLISFLLGAFLVAVGAALLTAPGLAPAVA
jgi:predicted metal-binding membrane protein